MKSTLSDLPAIHMNLSFLFPTNPNGLLSWRNPEQVEQRMNFHEFPKLVAVGIPTHFRIRRSSAWTLQPFLLGTTRRLVDDLSQFQRWAAQGLCVLFCWNLHVMFEVKTWSSKTCYKKNLKNIGRRPNRLGWKKTNKSSLAGVGGTCSLSRSMPCAKFAGCRDQNVAMWFFNWQVLWD